MRKDDKGYRKTINELYKVYEIKGLNLDRLVSTVKKRKINMFNIKKKANNRLSIAVSYADSENFFAIAKELCYNIKEIKVKGRAYPLYLTYKSIGLIIGGIIFLLSCLFTSDLVLGLSFSGSGAVYEREITEYLESRGVNIFSRFSSLDLERLEDEILAQNEKLSFVSLAKGGNTLVIDLALAKEQTGRLDQSINSLYSDVSGVIEKIKIYRGTAVVKVGDTVANGDLLVDGYMTVKDQKIKTNVLGYLSVIAKKTYFFTFPNENSKALAELFALNDLGDREITDLLVNLQRDGENFLYTVDLFYRHILYAG